MATHVTEEEKNTVTLTSHVIYLNGDAIKI